MEENDLGQFELNAKTAWNLGRDNVGVFIGNCASLAPTLDLLKALEDATSNARWVLVAATEKMAAVIVQRWFLSQTVDRIPLAALEIPKSQGNILLCTPESLSNLDSRHRQMIAGLLLIDMLCNVHEARGIKTPGGFRVQHDRPQFVANFRGSLLEDGWTPPFLILTQKPAKAVWTDTVARAYCLDALWFVDGRTLLCGTNQTNNKTHSACSLTVDSGGSQP